VPERELNGVVELPLPCGRPSNGSSDRLGELRERFVVGPENRLVLPAVRAVLEQSPNGFNPVVLYGPSGVGKSRLVEGLAAGCKTKRRRVICTTGVDFARDLAEALETQSLEEFRSKHRSASYWFLEDLHVLASQDTANLSAQEEILHTIDVLLGQGSWIVVTTAASPLELKRVLPGLRSRLSGGLLLRLSAPGFAARLTLVRHLACAQGVKITDEVAEMLARAVEGPMPVLSNVLHQIIAAQQENAGSLAPADVRRYLAQQHRARRPQLAEIAAATARYFSLRVRDLCSTGRHRTLVTARGIVAYLARKNAEESFTQIAHYLGRRDHTTIIHSCRRIEERMQQEESLRSAIKELQAALWKT